MTQPKTQREHHPDVRAVSTATKTIEAGSGQSWYRTRAVWELWQEEPLARLLRIPRPRVYWIIGKEGVGL